MVTEEKSTRCRAFYAEIGLIFFFLLYFPFSPPPRGNSSCFGYIAWVKIC